MTQRSIWVLLVTLIFWVLVALGNSSSSSGARILFYFAWSSYSNKLAVWPLVEKLAERNHSVTFLSPHPPISPPQARVTEFRPKGLVKYFRYHEEHLFQDLIALKLRAHREGESLKEPREAMVVEACGVTFKSSDFKPWLDRSRFDLVVIDSPLNECGMALAYKWNAPFVFFVSSGSLEPWQGEVFGVREQRWPDPSKPEGRCVSAWCPMSAWERLMGDMITPVWSHLSRAHYLLPKLEQVSKKWLELPQVPSFIDFERNASLVLYHGHVSVQAARYLPPHFIPVGGMRCSGHKDVLSDDMARFLTEKGKDGFIYVNFGTMVDFYKAPDVVITKLFDALRNVGLPILWKWGSKAMPANAPDNVFFASWIPQNAVLGHPKVKVFIYHGGPLSTQEAIYHGVPVIVFPLTREGERQAQMVTHLGVGIRLEIGLFTQYELTTSLRTLLKDHSFRRRCIKMQGLYKDRPQNPTVGAVWWLEYVMRHHGAHFLKPESLLLTWYQRRFLDALLWLLVAGIAAGFILWKVFRFLKRPKTKVELNPASAPARKMGSSYLKFKDKLS